MQTASDGSVGGNDIATAIGALRGGAVDRAYASFVTRVGTEMNEASNGETNAQALLNAVPNGANRPPASPSTKK